MNPLSRLWSGATYSVDDPLWSEWRLMVAPGDMPIGTHEAQLLFVCHCCCGLIYEMNAQGDAATTGGFDQRRAILGLTAEAQQRKSTPKQIKG